MYAPIVSYTYALDNGTALPLCVQLDPFSVITSRSKTVLLLRCGLRRLVTVVLKRLLNVSTYLLTYCARRGRRRAICSVDVQARRC